MFIFLSPGTQKVPGKQCLVQWKHKPQLTKYKVLCKHKESVLFFLARFQHTNSVTLPSVRLVDDKVQKSGHLGLGEGRHRMWRPLLNTRAQSTWVTVSVSSVRWLMTRRKFFTPEGKREEEKRRSQAQCSLLGLTQSLLPDMRLVHPAGRWDKHTNCPEA
jgi:hypothetical protein